jgi:hypothetical protein
MEHAANEGLPHRSYRPPGGLVGEPDHTRRPAKALGLTAPTTLLAEAGDVIEWNLSAAVHESACGTSKKSRDLRIMSEMGTTSDVPEQSSVQPNSV